MSDEATRRHVRWITARMRELEEMDRADAESGGETGLDSPASTAPDVPELGQ